MLTGNTPYANIGWDPFAELTRLQRAVNQAFDSRAGQWRTGYPPLNIAANENEVVVTAELPGVESGDLDIVVQGNLFSLKGTRKPAAAEEGEYFHRRERRTGDFARSIELPYNLSADNVQATLKDGILKIVLPRAEGDKPRKIEVSS